MTREKEHTVRETAQERERGSSREHARDGKHRRGGKAHMQDREGICTTEGEHKESKEKCLGGNGTLCETGIERKVPGMMRGEHARVGNCTQSRREEDRRERGEDSMCAGESMQERRYIQEGKNEMLTKPETEKV